MRRLCVWGSAMCVEGHERQVVGRAANGDPEQDMDSIISGRIR